MSMNRTVFSFFSLFFSEKKVACFSCTALHLATNRYTELKGQRAIHILHFIIEFRPFSRYLYTVEAQFMKHVKINVH